MHADSPVADRAVHTEPGFSLRRIGRLHHDYADHPLLRLEHLRDAAHRLQPAGKCRFLQPGSSERSAFSHADAPQDGRSLDACFDAVEAPGTWIALYDLQRLPDYARFLRGVMDSIELRDEARHRPSEARGYVFISTAPSATPFHIDRDDNFWLQVRGRKRLRVWDRRDRATVAARHVEAFINHGGLDNVRMPENAEARAFELDAGPGDGLYFPSTSPHAARTGDAAAAGGKVSVSLAVTFVSDYSQRLAQVHGLNCVLRKLGLDPRTEVHPALDACKVPLGRAVIALRRRLSDYRPPVWE